MDRHCHGCYVRSLDYDTLGRPTDVYTTLDGVTYQTTLDYDNFGRVATLTYPDSQAGSGSFRYAVNYHYDNWGLLHKITDPQAPTPAIWQAETMDPWGGIREATLGNGVTSQSLVDAATGRLRTISAFGSQSIQDLAYTWDARGNLDSREDNRLSLREDFKYDALSRLKTATVAGGPTLALTYDAVGNIQTKTYSNSAVAQNNYALTLIYSSQPDHRLIEIQGDLAADVVYNANGEMTRYEDPATGAALMSVDWTAFNKPDEIVRNGEISTFRYATDRSRYRHQYTEDGENIIRHYVEGVFEVVDRAGPTEYHHHILAAGEVVAGWATWTGTVPGTVPSARNLNPCPCVA